MMGQLTEEQYEKAFDAECSVGKCRPYWKQLTERDRKQVRDRLDASAPHLQFDVLTECDPPTPEEYAAAWDAYRHRGCNAILTEFIKGRADKNKALASERDEWKLKYENAVDEMRPYSHEVVKSIADERDILKARVAELELKLRTCVFCHHVAESVADLKMHSDGCEKHPIASVKKKMAEMEAELAAMKASTTEFTPEMLERVRKAVESCWPCVYPPEATMGAQQVISRLSPKPKTPEELVREYFPVVDGYDEIVLAKISNADLWMVQRKILQPLGPGLSGWVSSKEEAWRQAAERLGLIAQLKAEGGAK